MQTLVEDFFYARTNVRFNATNATTATSVLMCFLPSLMHAQATLVWATKKVPLMYTVVALMYTSKPSRIY